MTVPVVHLAMPGRSGVSACGRRPKHVTSSAEGVTCQKCLETWSFVFARHRCPECPPWPKFPPGALNIMLHGVPRWGFRQHCGKDEVAS